MQNKFEALADLLHNSFSNNDVGWLDINEFIIEQASPLTNQKPSGLCDVEVVLLCQYHNQADTNLCANLLTYIGVPNDAQEVNWDTVVLYQHSVEFIQNGSPHLTIKVENRNKTMLLNRDDFAKSLSTQNWDSVFDSLDKLEKLVPIKSIVDNIKFIDAHPMILTVPMDMKEVAQSRILRKAVKG